MFFQLNLGEKKKNSGKCVSFNRRLSVKGREVVFIAVFSFLMSPAFQMQPVFLQMSHFNWDLEADHGPQTERPWSCFAAVCLVLVETGCHTFHSEVSSMLSCAKGKAENGRRVLPWRAARPLWESRCIDNSIHSVLPTKKEGGRSTVARGRFRVANGERLTLKQ